MTTYVALLRGINVGGHRKLPMADLRALLQELKYGNVRTYLQSGNVVFDAPGSQSAVHKKLSQAIAEQFYEDVPVLLRTRAQWQDAVEHNPFVGPSKRTPKLVHAVFLSTPPARDPVRALAAYKTGKEAIATHHDTLYLHTPEGFARTKLTPTVLERVFQATTTARNWQTITAILEMLNASPGF